MIRLLWACVLLLAVGCESREAEFKRLTAEWDVCAEARTKYYTESTEVANKYGLKYEDPIVQGLLTKSKNAAGRCREINKRLDEMRSVK